MQQLHGPVVVCMNSGAVEATGDIEKRGVVPPALVHSDERAGIANA